MNLCENHNGDRRFYIFVISEKQTPTLLSWLICISINLMLIITPLKPNTRTLSRPIPTRHLGGNGVKRNRRLQFLPFMRGLKRKHKIRQYTPIYLRKKPLNCYHGGYTYQLISCLLRHLPCGQQVGLKDICKKNRFTKQTPQFLSQGSYTVRKGRYSDKQSTNCSATFTTLI